MRRTEIEQIKTLIRPYIRDKNRYAQTPLYGQYKYGVMQSLDMIDAYAEYIGYNHKNMSVEEYEGLLKALAELYRSGQGGPVSKVHNHAVALSCKIVKMYWRAVNERKK